MVTTACGRQAHESAEQPEASVTPTMRELFRQHHRLSDQERTESWRDCTFALDTNVLLNVYRYADATRGDLFNVLRALDKRIYVPYQVATEFYRNRLAVIEEQRAKYSELTAALDATINALHDGTFRKSAFLRIAEVEAILQPAVDSAKKLIEGQREGHPDLIRADPFLETLVDIVGTQIGTDCSPEQRDAWHTEAENRIAQKKPPGYRDQKKPAPERYGDALIWFELLALAKRTGRPVVLITDDDKEDWWQIVAGGKLGPRPELREEMRAEAGVEFYMQKPAYLLQEAGKELQVKIAPSSIEDANKITAELRDRAQVTNTDPERKLSPDFGALAQDRERHRDERELAEQAVGNWLLTKVPGGELFRRHRRPFDFVVRSMNGDLGVDVRLTSHPSSIQWRMRFRELALRAFYEIAQSRINTYLLVVVVNDAAESISRAAHSLLKPISDGPTCGISMGLVQNGIYVEFARAHGDNAPMFIG